MKVRSHSLRPSVARGIAVMCAALFVASSHPTYAGIKGSVARFPRQGPSFRGVAWVKD